MTVKRSQFAAFLNTTPSGSASYDIIGDGVTTATVNYNPQTEEEVYIHQDSGTTEIVSYRPNMPIEAKCKDGDDVFDFVDELRQNMAVLEDAKSDVVLVYLYEQAVQGSYPAQKFACSVQIDSFGGDGGASNTINYTINFQGDPIAGTFKPADNTFTPNP